jgi:hypothetical protein
MKHNDGRQDAATWKMTPNELRAFVALDNMPPTPKQPCNKCGKSFINLDFHQDMTGHGKVTR